MPRLHVAITARSAPGDSSTYVVGGAAPVVEAPMSDTEARLRAKYQQLAATATPASPAVTETSFAQAALEPPVLARGASGFPLNELDASSTPSVRPRGVDCA